MRLSTNRARTSMSRPASVSTSRGRRCSNKVPEAEEEVEETLIEVEEVAVVLEAEEEDQAAGLC